MDRVNNPANFRIGANLPHKPKPKESDPRTRIHEPNITHRLVVGVNKDNLVVLVNTVLVDPVRVKHTQVSASASNTLLSGAPQSTLELEVVDTLAYGLTVGRTYLKKSRGGSLSGGRQQEYTGAQRTLRHRLFPVTAAHAHTVDQVALLGFVAKAASLIGAGRTRGAVDDVELAVLPAALWVGRAGDY